ncbi:hypothetical protein D3C80_1667060 [compost metagenome]
MQEGFLALVRGAGEELAIGLGKVLFQVLLRFFNALTGHFQQQVMFKAFAVVFHPFRQVAGGQMAQALHQPVGQVVRQ